MKTPPFSLVFLLTAAPLHAELAPAGTDASYFQEFEFTGAIAPAGLVFAGYGMEIPSDGDFGGYNSYFHLDITDQWVLVFRFMRA